jgi:protein SCO1
MRVLRSLLYVLSLAASLFSWSLPIHAAEKQYPTLPFASDFGGSFRLTDHTGRVVTDEDFRGQYVILYFGFTDCADICPLALHSIGRALKQIEPLSDHITPLFVNLDHEKDSLQAMQQYVHFFHPRFIGLTGSEQSIRSAAGSYGIRYRYVKNDDGSIEMAHSGKIFLLGPDGNVLSYFPHEASVDWLATVMKRKVQE